MTLCLRVRDPEGKWDTPLLSREAPEDRYAGILYSTGVNRSRLSYEASQRARQGKALEFLWRTEPLERRVKPEYFNYESNVEGYFSRERGLRGRRTAAPGSDGTDRTGRNGTTSSFASAMPISSCS